MPQSPSTAGIATRPTRPGVSFSATGKSIARLAAPCARLALPYFPRQARPGKPVRAEDAAMACEAEPAGVTSAGVAVGLAGVAAEATAGNSAKRAWNFLHAGAKCHTLGAKCALAALPDAASQWRGCPRRGRRRRAHSSGWRRRRPRKPPPGEISPASARPVMLSVSEASPAPSP